LTTAIFEIQSSSWRVRWSAAPNNPEVPGTFTIYAYREGNALWVAMPACLMMSEEGGSDVSYIHTGTGRYYLVIYGGLMDWTVAVEDER
jgi:hypothetical protein